MDDQGAAVVVEHAEAAIGQREAARCGRQRAHAVLHLDVHQVAAVERVVEVGGVRSSLAEGARIVVSPRRTAWLAGGRFVHVYRVLSVRQALNLQREVDDLDALRRGPLTEHSQARDLGVPTALNHGLCDYRAVRVLAGPGTGGPDQHGRQGYSRHGTGRAIGASNAEPIKSL